MRCPVCNSEYVAGIETCAECLVPLVPQPACDEPEGVPDDPAVVAAEVFSPVEADIVCSLLQAHGIPCLLKAENQYAVDASYTIGPLARRRILVRQSDLARARDILTAFPLPEADA
jgi:hypothetical protein